MSGRILIVEDETIVALDLRMRVEALGYTVAALAHSGARAVQLAEEHRPDLVLMDIHLGEGMDGIEAATLIRDRLHAPVVFITAYADPDTLERARGATPYGYLVKPFEELALRSTLEMALARHQMESDLRAREGRFRALLENGRDVIAILDADGRVTYASPSAGKTLGYAEGENLGRQVRDLVHPEDQKALAEAMARLLEEPEHVAYLTLRLRGQDGSWHWLETVAQNALHLPGVQGLVINARDVTERLLAEEDRHRLETQMREAQKLESLGMLAGGIAHDFNNLLMGIMGNAGLAMLDLDESHPAHKRVKQIEVAALRAAELTNQMLAYSGKGRFLVQTMDLARLVEEMASLLHTVISKRATLRFEGTPGKALTEADATQIRQVVMNLITNASDALGDKGGTITLRTGVKETSRTTPCLAGVPPEGLAAFLEVTDTGGGMEPDTLQRIFDPFFTTKFTGRGLGLSAVLGIVRGHKGAIQVRSIPGEGTTFRLLFPLSARDQEAPEPTPVQDPGRGHGLILVVDDEAPVRLVARGALEHAGFEVLEAADGQEALDLFSREGDRIRALLVDLTMPRMGGDELVAQLRARGGRAAEVPVVLSSGYSAEEVERRAGTQPGGFIHKPYRPKELMALMVKVVGGGKAGA